MEDVANLADLLPTYYTRLFPFHDYYRWLSYGNGILIMLMFLICTNNNFLISTIVNLN